MGKSKMNLDANNTAYQAFPTKGGFSITASTSYTKSDIDSDLLGITTACTLTMSDALVVPYSAGAVIALREDETYTFDTTFVAAIS